MVKRALRWLSRHAYGSWVPLRPGVPPIGAERFLEDLWRDAPPRVALGHALMAVAMCVLPVALLRTPRPLPFLAAEEREAFLMRLLHARAYALRILGYATRGNALVAVLREPEARAALLGPGRPWEGASRPSEAMIADAAVMTEPRRQDAADYVIIGSGAAGATVAAALGDHGVDTIVLEEGGWRRTHDFTEDLYGALATLFRDFGAQVARGRAIFPVLEGCCVGGSTVMNGAIVHRLPKEVHDEWCRDPAIAAALPFAELEKHAARIEEDLGITANLAPLLARLPIAATLRRLGWAHQAMRRNAPGCQASGRCLQGCPSGGKLSMEASYMPRALHAGVRVLPRHRVSHIVCEGGRAIGVIARDREGRRRVVRARKAVILAAGAIQSPLLLRRSGLGRPHVGHHFQCHLGVGTVALLPHPVREIEGPPQGVEVLEFEPRGIKLATQLLPPELLLARTCLVGGALVDLLRQWDRISSWTASVRAQAEGSVGEGLGGTWIRFTPRPDDLERLRYGVWRLAHLFFELGAVRVFPNIAGIPDELRAPHEVDAILSAPLDPRAYFIGVGHIFGTCRMGGDPRESVVAPDFRLHGVEGLYVVDASAFPTNIGVNPQLAVMALARHAAHTVLRQCA